MQLLEYEGKRRARLAGLSVPEGYLAASPAEAAAAASRLGERVVVKAQVPVGGRAKAGGVIVCDRGRAASVAGDMIGTKVGGHLVSTVLVEEFVPAKHAAYLAITIDPRQASPVLLLGLDGGVDVNQHAAQISKTSISLLTGLHDWHVWHAASRSGAGLNIMNALIAAAKSAYQLFLQYRADLVELNPLLITDKDRAVAADVRIVLSGHEMSGVPGMSRVNHGFDLIELDPDGYVGLITTGAGASMLLVDLLTDAGLRPTNFCDIRSGSLRGSPDRLLAALNTLKTYPSIACVGVNVFAGITDLAEFAELLVLAIRSDPPAVPVVVRVEGKGVEPARRRLRAAGLNCVAGFDELIEEIAKTVARRSVGTSGSEPIR